MIKMAFKNRLIGRGELGLLHLVEKVGRSLLRQLLRTDVMRKLPLPPTQDMYFKKKNYRIKDECTS